MLPTRESSMMSNVSADTLNGPRLTVMQSIIYIKDRRYLYISVCTGNLLALLFGLSYSWSSPALLRLTSEEYLDANPVGRIVTTDEASWIGSFLCFGGIFGTFVAGTISQYLGRKMGLLLGCALPFGAAYTIIYFATTVELYYVARVLVGLAVSGVYAVVPVYLVEISEDDIRGFVCCTIFCFETLGELIGYATFPHLTMKSYSVLFLIITGLVVVLIIIFLPESPFYYLSVGNKAKAEKALMRVRTCPAEYVRDELNFLEEVVNEINANPGSLRDIPKTKAGRKAAAMSYVLITLQHLSGLAPMSCFSQNIFAASGSTIHPDHSTLAIGIVQLLASFIAPNLVEVLGRRYMLFLSALGMALSESALGTYFFMKDQNYNMDPYFWVPVTCFVSYLISYIGGMGPLLWTILGEVFPPEVKAPAFSLGVCYWWGLAFAMNRAFYPLASTFSMATVFWMFSVDCYLCCVFALTCLVETKGKTLEEIQEILNK